MKIWIAYCNDRHIDPVIFAEMTREKAIEKARNWMKNHVANPSALKEEEIENRWIMYYESESDNAFVLSCELNDLEIKIGCIKIFMKQLNNY